MSNYIDPERDQFDAFKKLPRDKPIMMLNFLRFREKAAYEDGQEAPAQRRMQRMAGRLAAFSAASVVKSFGAASRN